MAVRGRFRQLATFDLFTLDLACRPLHSLPESPGGVYLVGSAERGEADFRDVDVRMILPDAQFDDMFASSALWQAFCLAWTGHLRAVTGLPVDFQVQRMTEANERHDGPRNSLGSGRRRFAALGDGTPYIVQPEAVDA